MYDAIKAGRTTLPPLRTVRLIILPCLNGDEDAVTEWIGAWRTISLREFTAANPRPAVQEASGARASLRIVASQ